MILRTGLAIVLAGIAGALANAAAAAAFVNPVLWRLALVPERYVIAVALVAAVVPVTYLLLPGAPGALFALFLLTLLPSLLAKLALSMMTGWAEVVALNFVYALAALVVYRLVAGGRAS